MTLPAEIVQSVETLQASVLQLKGVLHALRQLAPTEEIRRECINGYSVLCGMTAEGNRLKTLMATGRMTGEIGTPAVEVTTLELHPAQYERTRSPADLQRMMESLHRAGDHTLDPDPAAAAHANGEGES